MTIAELEAALDRTYLRHPLPHPNRVLATWYCLTASEDAQRNLFTSMGVKLSIGHIIFYLDRYKYSMRYALDRIAKETLDRTWTAVPRRVVPKLYVAATYVMFAGVDYALASQVCGALHTGTATAVDDADAWRVCLDESHHDKAYTALELLGVAKPKGVDFAALLFHWIRNPSAAPEAVEQIAKSVSVTKGLVSYEYRQDLALKLVPHIPQPPYLIPEAWKFTWGGRAEVTLLLNALSLRCIYHIVAVHFGSGAHGLRGGGDSNIVLVLSREQLITDLELMSSLDKTRIREFVDSLAWGRGTNTPDPALQPLIPIGSGVFAIPCIHLLSSSQERNLLSLMARTQPQAFDAQSRLFEQDMLTSLLSSSLPFSVELRSNVRPRVDGVEEEIDLLLVDVRGRRLLVCELRWMLGPGDPREVQNRKNECFKKVGQVRRKVEWVSARAEAVAAIALGRKALVESGGGWITTGVVLIAGFGGTRSPDSKYPILPVTLFARAMGKASSLEALAFWCDGLSWLPQEGKHFTITTMEIDLDGSKPLILQGMDTPDSAGGFISEAVAGLS
jgi:hypothetical protein